MVSVPATVASPGPVADAHDPARAARVNRWCLGAALGLTLAWFFVYSFSHHDYLVDESGHVGDIVHFLEGKPGWPEQMTMLPGYHFLVLALWKLHPPCDLLTLARAVSTVFALAGLGIFAWAWRRMHPAAAGDAPGRMTLLLALLPLLQPFTAMAYTDAPALTLLLAGTGAHFARRPLLATVVFAIAAVFRQTNLLWPALLIAVDFFDAAVSRRELVRRHLGHALLLLVALAIVLKAGRATLGTATGSSPRPNIATLHLAGVVALLLGLPVWIAHVPDALRRACARPRLAIPLALAGLALAAVLALTYTNFHAWNREVSWPGDKFVLLRNFPLIWIDAHPWLRAASGLNLVLMSAALAWVIARQPQRRAIGFTLLFGAVVPAANYLVEPRYFIPIIAFFLFFFELPRADVRRLTIWWALLCLIHAPFVARGLSLW